MHDKQILLVISPVPDLVEPFRNALEGEGYEVHSAPDAEAWEARQGPRPRLVLLAPGLPLPRGLEWVHALESSPACAGIPFLLLSVSEEPPSGRKPWAAHIRLPVNLNEFLAKVAQALTIGS